MQQNKERFELPSGNPPRLTDAKVAAALKSGKDNFLGFSANHFETHQKSVYLAKSRQLAAVGVVLHERKTNVLRSQAAVTYTMGDGAARERG